MRGCIAGLLLVIVACAPRLQVPVPDLRGAEDDVVQAVQEAVERVRAEPGSAELWAALGDRYMAHRWHTAAAECYGRAENVEPQEFLWPYLGGLALESENPAAAAEAIARALELDERYAPAHVAYAECLVRTGDSESARRHFDAGTSSTRSSSISLSTRPRTTAS